jgi:class I fructose-bisphosphate aldolase
MNDKILDLLGDEAGYLLDHECKGIARDRLHAPGPDFVDRVYSVTDRNNRTLGNLEWLFQHGRLAGTGYVSILPVDQGIEHAGGASFAKNPDYFDPAKIVELAIEGGCNAVASTFGVLGSVARKYAHKIPFLVKFNHNELLTYPNSFDQVFFGSVQQAHDMGAAAVGATIYYGSEESSRQIVEVAEAFAYALRGAVPVPVVLHDERLSTVEADRALRDAGVSGRERRQVVDRSAATVILQSYLDSLPRE